MKIEIRQLRPNPFRNIDEYPISKEKVAGLVKSIKDTSFWDNILARPSPGRSKEYEIAYGHHRLMALRKIHGESSSKTIDIPVRELDDATMLKIMANENAKDWAMDTVVVTETVKAAERFLTKRPEFLYQYKTASGQAIAEFLGGIFSEAMVNMALAIIHAVDKKEVDPIAAKMIKQPTKAYAFVKAVKQSEKPVPLEDQRAMAKLIKDEKVATADVKTRLRQWGNPQKKEEKKLPDVKDFLWEKRADVKRLRAYLVQLDGVKEELRGGEWVVFRNELKKLRDLISKLIEGGEYGRKKAETQKKIGSGHARRLLS